MAHKTFISYKYSECQTLRDDILVALGPDASYYQGETSDSPYIGDLKTETIKKKLSDMIYDTSVTIVIVSPNMTKSKWIDWEIEYSLKEVSRDGRTSKTNGVVGVIQKVGGSYDWINTLVRGIDGCTYSTFDHGKLYPVIWNNRFNQVPKVYVCQTCQTVSEQTGCYFSLIKEEEFVSNATAFVENAYQKAQEIGNYKLTKKV